MENKKFRLAPILALLFFLLLCLSGILNYKLASYIDGYEEQIEKQDSMIRKLTFRNELVEEYFDIKEDTVNHTMTYSLKENKRDKEVEHITEYVDPIFIRDGKRMTSDELVAAVNANDKKSLESIRDLVDKYNTLVHDYNELSTKYQAKNDTVVIQGMALGLIKRNYEVDYTANCKGDTRIVKVHGAKVDSALMLLPYYRNKLFFDQQSKAWVVEYERSVKK